MRWPDTPLPDSRWLDTRWVRVSLLIATLSIGAPSTASAHHSVGAWFERGGVQEIEGTITELRWQNPHVLFLVEVSDAGGESSVWEIETFSISGIQRWGITEDLLRVGERVRVSGWPSRRGLDNIFARNVLLETGQELTFGAEPIYSDDALVSSEFVNASEGVAADADRGIFRVWSQGSNAGWLFPEGFVAAFDIRSYPLTPAALAALEAFDYLEQDPTIGCRPKGMPVIMEQPYPMEFVHDGDRILLRIEEYDQVRTIHLRNAPDEASALPSRHGFSVGSMEGRELRVRTTKINSGTFDSVGLPLSLEAWLEERFVPSDDGATLDYYLTVHDPVYFTAPVETHKQYIYLPDVRVEQFNCRR